MKLAILLFISLIVVSTHAATLVLSVTNGKTAGGTVVNLSGKTPPFSNLATVSATFGTTTVSNSSALSGNTFNVQTPPEAAGSVSVTATVNSVLYSGATFVYQDITLTSCSPLTGPSAGNTVVTCTGTGFINDNGNGELFLLFGGNFPNSVTFISTTQIQAPTPSSTSGTSAPITATNNGDVDSFSGSPAINFLYQDTTVTSISPTSGPAVGGTVVTVTGTGFLSTFTPTCQFGTSNVVATSVTSTSATCTAPAGPAAGGAVSFAFSNNGADFPSTTATFTYLAITLNSISPTTGLSKGGDTITLTGNGFATGMQCQFGTAPLVTATVNSLTSATCSSPAGTSGTTVPVSVTNDGTNFSGTFSFIYQDFTLTSISPNNGPSGGMTTVTLTGTGFENVPTAQCNFGGTSVTATYGSATSVTCTAPAGSGTVLLTYTNDGQDFTAAQNFIYQDITVTSIAPTSGPTGGNTVVTVTGTGFITGDTFAMCSFGVAGTVTAAVSSSTTATCTSPAYATGGNVNFQFSNNGQSYFGSATFNYILLTLTSITPTNGPTAGNTVVTLTGTGFTSGMKCKFGTSTVTATIATATSATCTAPSGSAGTVLVSVSDDGINFVGSINYQYIDPSVTSISPNNGPTAGGTVVTITGTNLITGDTFAMCKFNTAGTVTATVNSATSATCTSPAFPAGGAVTFSFSNNGQTFVGSFTFTYSNAAVTSIAPTSGPTIGGNTVTVTGSGFIVGDTSASCSFGANTATATIVSTTSATCTAPAGSIGAVTFSFSNNGETSVGSLSYTYVALSLTSITPTNGPTAGSTTVTVTGNGFASTMKCQFGAGNFVGATVASLTSATCSSPSHVVGSVAFSVTNDGTTFSSSLNYLYQDSTFTGILPNNGPTVGNTVVTISGTNFVLGDTSAVCKFGLNTVTATIVNVNSATCTSPAGSAGAVTVTFSNNGQNFLAGSFTFTYSDASVTSISPTSGLIAGGTVVTLTGTGFVAGSTTAKCQFGTVGTVTATIVSGTSATCTSPATATTGPVTLQFSNNGATFVGTSTFTYIALTLTSITPNNGPTVGGTTVTVTGSGFVSGMTCKFGTSSVTSTIKSGTSATCAAPAELAGSAAFSISDDGVTFVGGQSYLYQDFTLTSISPNNGPTVGGTVITLTGTGFLNGGVCSFATSPVTVITATVAGATSATCTSPAGSGTINLSYSNNAADFTAAQLFTYQDITVGSLSPNNGIPAGGTTITVTGSGFLDGPNLMCKFGSTSVPASYIGPTKISCVAPAGTPGTATVSVSNNGVQYQGSGIYTYQAAPSAGSLSPTSATPGITVTVTGGPFISGGKQCCEFGGPPPIPAVYISSTQISCNVPAGTGTVAVTVSNNCQDFGSSISFTYAPTITNVAPANGKSAGGTALTISGSGFVNTGNTACQIGGAAGQASFISPTSISCVTPPGTNGANDTVLVSNDGVTFFGTLYYVYSDIFLYSTSPSNGKSAGSTPLNVTGDGFLAPPANIKCTFSNGQTSVTATYQNKKLITLNSPSGPNGVTATFFCSNNGADDSGSLSYRYQDMKSTKVTPTSGAKNGGTTISITTSVQNVVTVNSTVECRFGTSKTVVATSITTNSFSCDTPTGFSGQNEEIFMSNNGIDFFDTGSTFAFNDAFKAVQYSAILIFVSIIALFLL